MVSVYFASYHMELKMNKQPPTLKAKEAKMKIKQINPLREPDLSLAPDVW